MDKRHYPLVASVARCGGKLGCRDPAHWHPCCLGPLSHLARTRIAPTFSDQEFGDAFGVNA
jgi:hypothetical protein